MFETSLENEIECGQLVKSLEQFQTIADLKLTLIGGGTGAVNLE